MLKLDYLHKNNIDITEDNNIKYNAVVFINRKIGQNKRIKKLKKPVIQYSLDMKLLCEYNSIKEAYAKTGINAGTISMAAGGKRNTAGKYKWKYKN